MQAAPDPHHVVLTIPAKGDFLVLARLALSAVCRLTPLEQDDVADLKLAVTEAAIGLVGPDAEERVSFGYTVERERLIVEIEGPGGAETSDEEIELGRAIVAATVDEHEHEDNRVRLVKYLDGSR